MTRSSILVWASLAFVFASPFILSAATHPQSDGTIAVPLPQARTEGGMSLTEALATRRSHRSFDGRPLSVEQISQLCWAALGITDKQGGLRTAPSALKLYAVRVYFVDGRGASEYMPESHALQGLELDAAVERLRATLGNGSLREAPAFIVLAIDPGRLQPRCGEKAERYSLLEAGHVCQNVLLQATALGLASVPVGGIDEAKAAEALKLPSAVRPVYAIPLGYAK
jgi:SagB-type dehydrogenase family enzyme